MDLIFDQLLKNIFEFLNLIYSFFINTNLSNEDFLGFVMKASDMLEDGAQLILQGYQIPYSFYYLCFNKFKVYHFSYDVSLFQTADHIQFLQQAMVNNRKTSVSGGSRQ